MRLTKEADKVSETGLSTLKKQFFSELHGQQSHKLVHIHLNFLTAIHQKDKKHILPMAKVPSHLNNKSLELYTVRIE